MKKMFIICFIMHFQLLFAQQKDSVFVAVSSDNNISEDSSRLLTSKGIYIVNYIAANFKYPDEALQNEISGIVVAEFIVEKDGSVRDVKIVKKLCETCDTEVVRVIKSTKYQVFKFNNEPQRVLYRLPVRMMLN